ncbi:hypothetical protein BU26DRAFT_550439 [Trematosphaeria pertusa]|uniref:Uncharacterized protein n=1 Tax=Trematosphaeria pertusa TaxID=390896 RepID=A0A6A6IIP6_9PLEO|nr:uncharacterized protein BU26DRAFT_550439 [Trematosphaeria pertusa]KAF2250246.1 hypothetical protein BU26DRAFT_550439 [Trematosphaeria pertusa]
MILPLIHRDAPPSIPSSSQLSTCGFPANNDIYGIGIRIGIYAQIIAVWFANYFLLSEVQVLRDTVSIFSVAVLIVSLIYASNPSSVHAVEAFILLQILAWSCIMGVRAKSSYTSVNFKSTVVRKVINEAINLASLCLHVWFWWEGLDRMVKTPCGTFLMYVVKTDMFGWARKVMMGLSVFVLTATVYWVGVEALRPWAFVRMRGVRGKFVRAVREWEEVQGREGADPLGIAVVDTDGNVDADADAVRESHECCSQYSCSRCSPVQSEFRLDREATLVNLPKRAATAPCGDLRPSPRISERATPHSTPGLAWKSPRPLSFSNPADQLSHPDFAILRQVYEGECYIQHCVSATPFNNAGAGKPLTPLTIIRSILSPRKHQSADEKDNPRPPPSWLKCHLHIWKTFLTFRFPPQSFVIYSDLRQSRLLDPLNGPFQMYASLTYASSLPPWPCISLASTLLLTAPSTPKKVRLAWYYALVDLCVHILVILQLELTLVWNRVNGLMGLWTSVGQLIPFIIGVGGLCLVGGRWIARWWEKRKRRESGKGLVGKEGVGDEEREGAVLGIEKEVREGYARWKETYETGLKRRGCGEV